MKTTFSAGDRVRVSDDFFWAKGAVGTIAAPPDAVTSIGGEWDGGLIRQEVSALGTNTVYWVWFDEPQHDADGDGPYKGWSNLGECPHFVDRKAKLANTRRSSDAEVNELIAIYRQLAILR